MAEILQAELRLDEWDKFVKGLGKKLKNITKTKEFGGIISATVFNDIMDHFDKETGPDGSWVAWSKVYAEHMRRIGRSGNKKLQFNRRLVKSITPKSWRTDGTGILFFNNAKTKSDFAYAKAHDEGGSVNGRPPQRKFMWLSNKAMSDIIDKTERWMAEG